jgi:glucan-binding YG repeat protein
MNNSKESMFSSPNQGENMNNSKESMFSSPNQGENMNKSKESMFSSPQPPTAPNSPQQPLKNQTPNHRNHNKKHPSSPKDQRVFEIGNDYFASASRLANPSSNTFFSVVADRSIFSCSASDKGISMILRIPERLMTAGTPMKTSLWLYSPSK